MMTPGEKITRASGSNFALAFLSLSPQKRRDIINFYAFCRVVDDLADDPGIPLAQRREALDLWRQAIHAPSAGEHVLAADFRATLERYPIDRTLLEDIITGMEMDLAGTRYQTRGELEVYCYRVAGAVGLVSIEIFGYRHASARDHARALGQALQLTNILRDVGEDYRNGGRIYLPLDDLEQAGYGEDDLKIERYNEKFIALMTSLARVAENHYAVAEAIIHPEDRRSLQPGLIMGDIYRGVLNKMKRKKFRVFPGKTRLNKMQKILLVLRRTWFLS